MGTTLQNLKKQRGLTNKVIAVSLHRSPSTVSMIMQGRHIAVYDDPDIQRLADILGVTFERCWLAMCESYNEWANTPGQAHVRYSERQVHAQHHLRSRGFDVTIEEPRSIVIDANVESKFIGK